MTAVTKDWHIGGIILLGGISLNCHYGTAPNNFGASRGSRFTRTNRQDFGSSSQHGSGVIEAGYLKAIDASSMDGIAYLEPESL